MGWDAPSRLQLETVPVALDGKDILCQARAGAGKTAAYLLPAMELILRRRKDGEQTEGVQSLILVATPRFCIRAGGKAKTLGGPAGLNTAVLPGGGGRGRSGRREDRQSGDTRADEFQALGDNPDIVITTPREIDKALVRGKIDLGQVRLLVLDDLALVLSFGLHRQIERVLSQTPADRQTIVVTEEVTPEIDGFASEAMRSPVEIWRTAPPAEVVPPPSAGAAPSPPAGESDVPVKKQASPPPSGPQNRLASPVFGEARPTKPEKTLGSKFRPRRKRRLI